MSSIHLKGGIIKTATLTVTSRQSDLQVVEYVFRGRGFTSESARKIAQRKAARYFGSK